MDGYTYVEICKMTQAVLKYLGFDMTLSTWNILMMFYRLLLLQTLVNECVTLKN